MEGREFEEVVTTAHNAIHKPTDSIAGGIEHYEERHDTKHIEEHVGESCTASLCVGSERGHKCRDSRSDVLTHSQCRCLFESEAGDVHAKEHQRDGHCGCRSLNDHGDQCTNDDEQQYGKERILRHMGQHASYHIANVHRCGRFLQECQTHEQKREAEYKLSNTLSITFIAEYQWHSYGQQGNGKCRNIYFESYG